MKRLGLILPVLLILSCGTAKKTVTTNIPEIPKSAIQTVWDLKKLLTDDVTGTGVFIVFTDSSHINGFGGCNIFTASSLWTGGKISVTDIAPRRPRTCDSTNIEGKIFSFLPQVDEAKMVNNTLQLYKAGVVIMDFEARVVKDED